MGDELKKSKEGRLILKDSLLKLVQLLSVFAPHMGEELWERMGQEGLLAHRTWPVFEPSLAREELVTIIVQVNGKLRSKFESERDVSEEELKEKALALDRIKNIIEEKEIKKAIVIPNKLVNIVI
jgi:leucyl-tRNA synthetase